MRTPKRWNGDLVSSGGVCAKPSSLRPEADRQRTNERPSAWVVVGDEPADDPEVTEQMWIEAARLNFGGSVIAGTDLQQIFVTVTL
jgi:hypothetical protein